MLKKKNNGFVNRFQFRKWRITCMFFLCVVELFNIKQTRNETTRTIYYKDITIFICPLELVDKNQQQQEQQPQERNET